MFLTEFPKLIFPKLRHYVVVWAIMGGAFSIVNATAVLLSSIKRKCLFELKLLMAE